MSLDLERYAGSSEFPVVDGGDYEVVLKIERKLTQDKSKEFANLDFMIRDDVEQKFQSSHVFDKAWKDSSNPQWFDLKKLGSILVTLKERPEYKDTYKTSFDEVDEFIQYINGITLVVTVEKKYDDFAQKEVNSIKYLSYKPSKHGVYVKPEKKADPAPVNGETGDVQLTSTEEAAQGLDIPSEVAKKFPF